MRCSPIPITTAPAPQPPDVHKGANVHCIVSLLQTATCQLLALKQTKVSLLQTATKPHTSQIFMLAAQCKAESVKDEFQKY